MTQTSADALTDTHPIPTVDDDTAPEAPTRAKLLDLSLTQLLGGSMAAATAAALGSRLGVVGTIAGAAVLSIVSAIAASLYTGSMARAKDAVVLVRSRRGGVAVVSPSRWRRPDRATTRRVLVMTGAVFAVAAAFLAGLQLATGAQVTGTDLGGRSTAGVVVDSPGGSSESGGGVDGTTAREDEAVPTTDPTATPAPTASTGTPEPTAPSTEAPTQATDPGAEVTTPATGAGTDAAQPSAPATPADGSTTPGATPTP